MVFSEVAWMGSDLSTSDEWVELAVVSPQSVDVSGWSITSLKSTGDDAVVATFPMGSVLQPGQTIVVSRASAAASRLAGDPYLVAGTLTLPNTKLHLQLLDANGVLMDEADDGVGDPMAGNNTTGQTKATMVRVDPLASGRAPSSWNTSVDVSGFDPDAPMMGSPGSVSWMAIAASSSSYASASSSISSESSSSSVDGSSADSAPVSSASTASQSEGEVDVSESSSSLFSPSRSSVPLLFIQELMPNPVGNDDVEWVEIGSTEDVVLSTGWALSDGTHTYAIGSGSLVQPVLPLLVTHASTGLVFPNGGGAVRLLYQGILADSISYAEVPEGVSIGHETRGEVARHYCVSTPGRPNERILPTIEMVVQSGQLRGQDKVTVNLELVARTGTLEEAACSVDYGDGHLSQSCNPPSHTIADIGEYSIIAEVKDFCGNTVTQQIEAVVWKAQEQQSSSVVRVTQSLEPADPSPPPLAMDLAAKGEILLLSALPNPAGKDTADLERITLQSVADSRKDLGVFSLRIDGKDVGLTGVTIDAHSTLALSLSSLHSSLKNTEGSVSLVFDGSEQERVAWKDAKDGVTYSALPADLLPMQATVMRVIDGDTIEVLLEKGQLRKTVRLRGIDAPEVATFIHAAQPMSNEAKKLLGSLTINKNIELQFDTEFHDLYGRTLAYVHLGDGTDVQKQLLEEGVVRVIGSIPFSRRADYELSEAEAKKQRRGLWKDEASISSKSPAESQKMDVSIMSPVEDLPPAVRFHEIYPSPKKDEKEWVELFNEGDIVADLAGWKVSEEVNGKEHRWVLPVGTTLAPGHLIGLRVGTGALSLNNGGQEVLLKNAEDRIVDRVIYPKISSGKSYALVGGIWCITEPTPEAENVCLAGSKASASFPVNKRPSAQLLASVFPAYVKTEYVGVGGNDETDEETTASGAEALFLELQEQVVDGSGELQRDVPRLPLSPWLGGMLVGAIGMYGSKRLFGSL